MLLSSRLPCVGWARLLAGMVLWVWLGLACIASAQPVEPQQPIDAEAVLSDSRKQIDQIREKLKTAQEDSTLVTWRNDVLDIQARANALAEALSPQLAGVTARLSELGPAPEDTREAPDVAVQRAELQRDRQTLDAQTKLARLLTVEAAQTAEQISTSRRTRFQARLGDRRDSILGEPFWRDLRDDLPRDLRRLSALSQSLGKAAASTPGAIWLALAVVAGIVWLLRAACGRFLVRLSTTRVPPGRLRRSLLAIGIVILTATTPGMVAALLYTGLMWNATLPEDTQELLMSLVAVVCFGGCVTGLGNALLSPDRPSWRLPSIHDDVAQELRRWPVALGVLVVLLWLADALPIALNTSLTSTILVTSATALLLIATLAWGLRRSTRLRKHASDEPPLSTRPVWASAMIAVTWVVLACSVASLLTGYVAFGSFIVKQVLWTLAILCFAYLLSILMTDSFSTLLSVPANTEDDARKRWYNQAAVLLAGIGRVMIGLVAATLLLAPFGEGPSDLLHRMEQLLVGLQIGEVHIRPQALMQGLLVLAFCLVGVRLLKRWLANRYLPTTELDPGMQLSAATLFGYAGVVLAIALSLSALGVGLERVAWIASALSVGIGFGLQAVVQNFVSGLILLAERPVKVGDWVSLGGVEGDIVRINVRATEIQMADRSTVIVPNSEFVTKTVRNVTHANPLGLVQVKLPMPLDADTQRVRDLILQAFAANENILETPPANVYLEGVENGHLMFNAKGYVSTPRNTYMVRSALLYDVLQRLAEAKLPLSSPATMVLTREREAGDIAG